MRILLYCFFYLSFSAYSQNVDERQILNFQFEDESLNGVLNLPDSEPVKGIVLIVHGYGKTNAVAQDWYADVRKAILDAGYGTYMWDKMGCGESTGNFDLNQPVENSADEAIAAIEMLINNSVPGAAKIGLWGISRAGWINPLIIQKYKKVEFWISWSGVDGKENFKYLLEQNARIDGLNDLQAKQVAEEWLAGVHIAHSGGSYSDYKKATQTLMKNPFWLRFTDGGFSWLRYFSYQRDIQSQTLDLETGLPVYIEDFDNLLKTIDVPVLAQFGEQDMNVDWANTQALYKSIFPKQQLTIHSYSDCNHNLFQAKSGGYYEFEDNKLPWLRCTGVLEDMRGWLKAL